MFPLNLDLVAYLVANLRANFDGVYNFFKPVDFSEVDGSEVDGLEPDGLPNNFDSVKLVDGSEVDCLEVDGFLPNRLKFDGLKIDGLKDGRRPSVTLQTKKIKKCNFILEFFDSLFFEQNEPNTLFIPVFHDSFRFTSHEPQRLFWRIENK